MNEVSGRIHAISDAVQVTEKLKKSLIVLETGDEYPQYIQLEVVNARIEKLAPFFEKDEVKIKYFLKGRLYTGPDGIEKCFTSLQLSDIEKC